MNTELTRYLDTHNLMLELFNQKPMGSLDDEPARKALFEQLASDMSPENLHCDGECTRHVAATRLNYFQTCWDQLEILHGRKVTIDEVWSWDR